MAWQTTRCCVSDNSFYDICSLQADTSDLAEVLFWFFLFDCLLLGWIGGKPIEAPYYDLGQFFTIFYFIYFFLFLPIIQKFEYFILTYKLKRK